MHRLAVHTAPLLHMYHTVGLFSESTMESIRAKVNLFASTFCSMTGDALVHQVLQSLSAQEDQKLRKQEMDDIEKEKKEYTDKYKDTQTKAE
jgi:hypothetical protein